MLNSADRQRIAENVAAIRDRLASALAKAQRPANSVTLVAVTKYTNDDVARALFEAGCRDLGESRPQELVRKADALRDLPIRWHLVGHLQRNKVSLVAPRVSLLHSLDSLRLAQALEAELQKRDGTLDVLVEVNVSGDAAKHGFMPGEILNAWPQVSANSRLNIRGLMTMASLEGGPTEVRRDFAELRRVRDRIREDFRLGDQLAELSMGMSDDLEEAILEGATIVRVGSALVEGLAHD
jgi:pyridoxal phosphate enzyme (YggS family)